MYRKHHQLTIDFTNDGRNVRIIMSRRQRKHCDVCIVGWWSHWTKFTAMVKQQSSRCKKRHSEASIIVVGKLRSRTIRLD